MSDLKNKVVLITGASSGIGAGTALHFATLGAKLALVARNKTRLEEISAQCSEAGSPEVAVFPHDLSKEEDCVQAVQQTVNHFNALDVVVNNAGVLLPAAFLNCTAADVNKSINIHVNAAMIISQTSLAKLRESQGNIVNVSSISGLRAYPGALAYRVSKAALDQLTRCMALEVANTGVRVNSVNPGVVDTEIFETAGIPRETAEAYFEAGKKLHPLGRIGRVDEVAKAIAFLASSDASFITGQTLAVDGGRSVAIPYTSYD